MALLRALCLGCAALLLPSAASPQYVGEREAMPLTSVLKSKHSIRLPVDRRHVIVGLFLLLGVP